MYICMAMMQKFIRILLLRHKWVYIYMHGHKNNPHIKFRTSGLCVIHVNAVIFHYTLHLYSFTVLFKLMLTLIMPSLLGIIQICNLKREYRDCIKSRRDKIRITRHIMMHQVLHNVHVTLSIGQLHNI